MEGHAPSWPMGDRPRRSMALPIRERPTETYRTKTPRTGDTIVLMTTWQERTKRAMDVLLAVVGLVVLSPLLLLLGIAVWATMGSPVLFAQRRPGLHGKPFTMFKFRTMRPPRGDEAGTTSDARRLTRLGRVLRRTSLDELPELWNVLRGDMSLVGPRPLLMEYLDRYTPQQARRHEVKPGMTGWAQVHGRNTISWEDRFQLDLWYVENRCLLLDLRIILISIWKVLRQEDIHAAAHAPMPEFLGSSSAVGTKG